MKKSNLLLLLIIGFVFWGVFLPFPHVASDLHLSFSDELRSLSALPSTWLIRGSAGFGQPGSLFLWNWPVTLLFGFLGKIGISHQASLKIFGFAPIILLGVFSLNKLFGKLNLPGYASFVGKVFYMTTTYLLLLVDGGQITIAASYAWLPFCYLKIVDSIEGQLPQKIVAALSICFLGFLDIRFVYILFILVLFRLLYSLFLIPLGKWPFYISQWFKTGVIIVIVALGINFYWVLPVFFSKALGFPLSYIRESQTSFLNFTQLKHSLSLLQPHWYENVFGKISPFRKEFLLIPALVFLAPILKRKDKEVYFWTAVATVSVFLTKGSNPPFPNVYPWLFTHIPGFSFFRDSTKFFFLVALSYSVLISFTVEGIIKRFPKFKIIFPLLLILYFLFLVRPVYLGKMTGTFSEPSYQTEYFSLASRIETDKEFGRILWIPSRTPLGFSSPSHPSVEALRLIERRPFASSVVGSYELTNFIRQSYMGELFDVSGIEYIVYPFPDTRREELKPDNIKYYNWFLGNISNLDWTFPVATDSTVPLIATKKHQDRFFLANGPFFVIGSDEIYSSLVKVPGFSLAKNALVFLEEKEEIKKDLIELPTSRIIVFAKDEKDAAVDLISDKKLIFPAGDLDFSPNGSGWWKRETADLVSWRNFLHEKYGLDNLDYDYGGGWAVAEGNRELKINLPPTSNIQHPTVLLARAMQSPRGGKIDFYQANELVGSINTKANNFGRVQVEANVATTEKGEPIGYDRASFSWVEVGSLKSDCALTIKTEGDINVVNSILAISENELNEAKTDVQRLVDEGRIIKWNKIIDKEKTLLFSSREKGAVTYKTIAPTHYQVQISNLAKPGVLVFSESYDSLWKMGEEASIPVYSILNGFYIDKDGTYDVYFSPQKYVVPGLIVSGLALLSLVGLAFTFKK